MNTQLNVALTMRALNESQTTLATIVVRNGLDAKMLWVETNRVVTQVRNLLVDARKTTSRVVIRELV